jgi:inhibitor of KinA sporulation pathway (predicted exonuclease)
MSATTPFLNELFAELIREIDAVAMWLNAGGSGISESRRRRLSDYESDLYEIKQLFVDGAARPEQIQERFEEVKEAFNEL